MNETLATIHSLRSIHGDFSDRPVVDADLETILAAAVRAANASNAQNYAVIVVSDGAVMREVCGFATPVMLLFCVDVHRNTALAAHLGQRYEVDPAWVLMTGVTDVALAAQTAVIAAKSLGIDSLVSNGVQRGRVERFWELLDLPPWGVYPVMGVSLGYAATKPEGLKGRLLEPGVVHRGRYRAWDAAGLDAIVAATDEPGFGLMGDGWRDKGHGHCLEAFFAGPGKRAKQGYAGLAPALRVAGIDISYQ